MGQIENYQAQEDNYYLILGLSFTIWMLLINFLMMLFFNNNLVLFTPLSWNNQHRTLTWYEVGCWQAGGMFDCRQQRDSPDTCPTRHSYYTQLLCSDLMWSASDIAYSSPLYMTKRSRDRCVTSWSNYSINLDFKYCNFAPDVEYFRVHLNIDKVDTFYKTTPMMNRWHGERCWIVGTVSVPSLHMDFNQILGTRSLELGTQWPKICNRTHEDQKTD